MLRKIIERSNSFHRFPRNNCGKHFRPCVCHNERFLYHCEISGMFSGFISPSLSPTRIITRRIVSLNKRAVAKFRSRNRDFCHRTDTIPLQKSSVSLSVRHAGIVSLVVETRAESKFWFYIDPTSFATLEDSMKNVKLYRLLSYLDAANKCLLPFSPC